MYRIKVLLLSSFIMTFLSMNDTYTTYFDLNIKTLREKKRTLISQIKYRSYYNCDQNSSFCCQDFTLFPENPKKLRMHTL